MNVVLKQASGGLPAYGHARSGTSRSRLRGRLSGALASIIFASDCRICESLLTTASRPICDGCLASFRRSSLASCDVCGVLWGVPGESDEEFAICPQCQEEIHAFERARRYDP